ncbi:MAG: class I SAM-dependent methyltransferase [bacterium]
MELEGLFCPYCGGELKISEIEWADGIVKCACSEWPFLSNILILKKGDETKRAIEYIKKGKPDKAAFLFLMKESKSLFFAWASLHRISFFTTMGLWGYKFWTEYTRYRFSSPTFLSFIPLASIIKETGGEILDFGCGVGHSLFFLSKWIASERITAVDRQFSALYLAKKFFCKEARFICLDGDFSLPFSNNTFSNILSLDSFHFVSAKKGLSSEFMRVLKDNGIILLSHLHNKNRENAVSGIPLAPSDYIRLFKGMEYRAVPDYKIKESAFEGKLDISINEDVGSFASFSLILTKNPKIFKGYAIDILENLKNPIINPIYNVKEKKAGFIVKRRGLTGLYRNEYPDVETYIKKEAFIYKRDIEARKRELFTKLFLVDAPAGYK